MNVFFKKNSPSLLLMKVGFYAGCVSFRGLRFLSDSPRSIRRTAQKLVQNGYLEDRYIYAERHTKTRVLIPTKKAMQEMTGLLFPDDILYLQKSKRYLGYRISASSEREKARISLVMRVVATSEQLCFIYGMLRKCNNTFPGRKKRYIFPGLKPRTGPLPEDCLAWYRSWEVKRVMNKDIARSCEGRAQGYLVNGKDLYSITSMNAQPILVRDRSERMTDYTVARTIAPPSEGGYTYKVILSRSMKLLERLVYGTLSGKAMRGEHPFHIDTEQAAPYPYYFIPYTDEGVRLMLLMITPTVPRLLHLIGAKNPERGKGEFLYDYVENGEYRLSFLVPDVYRLKRFIKGLYAFPEKNGRIFIFDFFEEEILQLIRNLDNLQVTVFRLDDIEQLIERRIYEAQ